MMPDQKFCEDCGKPMTPGKLFCEECGAPVRQESIPEENTPVVPAASPGIPQLPLAVMPFGHQDKGVFSTENLTLLIYPDRLILAIVPKARQAEFDEAMIDVQAELMKKHIEGKSFWQLATGAGIALFKLGWSPVDFYTADAVKEQKMLRNISITNRPWEQYLSMPADAVLVEDTGNREILREQIGFIRGESDPSTSTDQILIYSSGGRTRIVFEFGIFFPARRALFSFLLPDPADQEKVLGIIPYAEEPEVEGFGFQYTWIVAVTEKRLIFCMIEDEFADEINEWIKDREKEGKKTGRDIREGELFCRPDAPWQRFMNRSVSSLLENEVNFFIPLSVVRSVDLIPNNPGQAVELCINLPGESYDLQFPAGSAGYLRSILDPVLTGKLNE